jgi:acetate kinase
MKILVLNSGSSSLKFQVIQDEQLRAKGEVENIGSAEAVFSCTIPDKPRVHFTEPATDHQQAIESTLEWLSKNGITGGKHDVDAVGHRVVHGGEFFHQSVLIDDDAVRKIESCIELAPLHNPANLKGYYAVRQLLPNVPQVAVFDTSFHHGMPMKARLYAIPEVYYKRDKIRRYGFHGTSHRFVADRFAEIHNNTRAAYKIISCHLGNGCSVCAIEHGRSVDTSMGFTPLEGLMMGTRAGDIDAGAVLHLLGRGHLSLEQMEKLLNEQSGLLGVSGMSNDMRELMTQSVEGNEFARLAIEMFCYRVRKYIGAYLAAMGGADVVLFTGGIGEHATAVREQICTGLEPLGIQIDRQRNASTSGAEAEISCANSVVKVWVIPTNEELVIARDTEALVAGSTLT